MKKIIASAVLVTGIVIYGQAFAGMGMGTNSSHSMMNSSGHENMMKNMPNHTAYMNQKTAETGMDQDVRENKITKKGYVPGEFRANLSEKERKALEREERYGR